MQYEQNIPFYIHTFEQFPWKKYETEHYIFHVEEGSLAEQEISSIQQGQEAAYKKIVKSLVLPKQDNKISYYFYSSREKKRELMGDDWFGQSIYNEFRIHVVYNETDKVVGEHEDTHLLSLTMGLPISLFQEGLAEMMVGKSMFGKEHTEVVKKGLNRGVKLILRDLMSQQGWLDTPDEEAEFFYSVAGSFVSYIFQLVGIGSFKKLYASLNRRNSTEENICLLESVTDMRFAEVELGWQKIL